MSEAGDKSYPSPTPDRPLNPHSWVEDHGDYLYRMALSRLRNREAAEEAVQETFVAALSAIGQYRGAGSERNWLAAILKRKVIDTIRRRFREAAVEDAEELLDSLFDAKGHWRSDPRAFGARPEAALEKQEFWLQFRQCLGALPQRQADAFTLRELDGKSGGEICKDLQVSPSNLWTLLHRARLSLSRCLKSHVNLINTST